MPRELLREVASTPFPHTIDDPAKVDKLRVLHAAGLVDADLPPPDRTPQAAATVRGLTAEGRAELRRHPG